MRERRKNREGGKERGRREGEVVETRRHISRICRLGGNLTKKVMEKGGNEK